MKVDLVKVGETIQNFPEGFRYQREMIGPVDEDRLLTHVRELPFRDFEFHGYTGKRRVVSFGWHYDFNGGPLKQAGELPDFLLPLRRRAAGSAGLGPCALEHALLIE